MEFKSVEINDGYLAYADYPGENGTIIGIHGLTGNHKQLHYYAEQLKDTYRFISIDLKGRGNSSAAPENTGIEQHTADILAFIEALEIENPILMGYSMGAFIMANVASKLPSVKAVVLLDGAATCTEHQRKIVEPSLARISKHYESADAYVEEVQAIYNRLGVTWTAHLESVVRYEVAEHGDYWKNKSDETKITQDFNSFYDYDTKAIVEKINCPILLIHSQGDIGQMPALFLFDSYIETLQAAKDIRKIASPTNHYTLVFEDRLELNAEIENFLNNL